MILLAIVLSLSLSFSLSRLGGDPREDHGRRGVTHRSAFAGSPDEPGMLRDAPRVRGLINISNTGGGRN